MEYHDVFPRSEGPPPVLSGKGRAELAKKTGSRTVTFDEGAFRAVWELTEATAKARWASRDSLRGTAAYVRGVEAFRKAHQANGQPDAATPTAGLGEAVWTFSLAQSPGQQSFFEADTPTEPAAQPVKKQAVKKQAARRQILLPGS